MSYTIIPQETPCLHCMLKNIPVTGVTCDTAGIISPTVQIVAKISSGRSTQNFSGRFLSN